MSIGQTLVKTDIIEVMLERFGQNQIRISWHPKAMVSKVSLFRASEPHFDESSAHLIAVVTQGGHWTFQDPQPAARGYYFVKFSEDFIVTVADRMLPLQGALNFRDMGGYSAADGRRVKWGKLFRSAELSQLTASDILYLQQLGIDWICDLRTSEEIALQPSPSIGRERNENLSFMPSASPDLMSAMTEISESMLADMNRHMVSNTALTAIIMKRLLAGGGAPALFHCAAGKDRTGFVSAAVLLAVGVPRETVLYDYALTNHFTDSFKEKMAAAGGGAHAPFMNKLSPSLTQALMEARPAYLQASFDEIDTRYGSFEQYWEEGLCLTSRDRERLQSMLLI
ncbi:tyrosine-protein phosphatase [Paenibacillus alkaliterrae]|uniref:tyrosine-protein phosphatase n=1 Tax=Paenibacillus alkaliterrae TaxID=320909 RepID=UPI001F1EE98E|nr:tyrosine-protein phosphatase [Paenibacillus alkaliterrae]MCF2941425.1 tyrosine-protein phosphatase [Paenibacillus alkaliterrae]